MKIFQLLVTGIVLVVFFAIPVVAQKEAITSNGKIATIDSKVFEDKDLGIKDLLILLDKIDTELKSKQIEILILAEKVKNNEKQLLPYNSKTIDEYRNLVCELRAVGDSYKIIWEKRNSELLSPLFSKINIALKNFAKRKGYSVILDKSEKDYSMIIEGETIDITKEFIKFYNDYSEKEKTP